MKKTIAIFIVILAVWCSICLFQYQVQAQDNAISQKTGTFYIDSQFRVTTFEGTNILIHGWIMTDDVNSIMKIYIDGKDTNIDLSKRTKRPDVLSAIKEYGGEKLNPNPGFEGTLNISSYQEGKHTITYCLEQADGTILYQEDYQVKFDNQPKGTFDIDSPNIYKGKPTIKETTLQVNGWMMTNDSTTTINIYIDGTKMPTTLKRTKRPDVIAAIAGYGGEKSNPTPGFETNINIQNLSQGTHKMLYQLETTDGKILAKKEANLFIQKGEFYIDTQFKIKTFEDISIFVSGWAMSNDPNSQMKIYIDGKDTYTNLTKRTKRPDVLKAIQGYGGAATNPTPGFEGILDLTSYKEGEHTVTYQLEQADGTVINSESYRVEFKNRAKGTFDIDTPNPYKKNTILKEQTVTIKGWIMSNDANATLQVLVDGNITNAKIETREEREDVQKAIKGYGNEKINAEPGFTMKLDLSSYPAGEHEITYELKASSGEILGTKKAKINLQKAEFYIEKPTANLWEVSKIKLQGWMMSFDPKATIKVFINEQEVTIENRKRTKRPDVIAAISGYGGTTNNPTPGWEGEIDISNINKGTHQLTYCLEAENGEILAKQTQEITIDCTPKTMLEIDTPDWRGVENVDGKITGWVMTNVQDYRIRVFIDQYERWDSQHRVERPDVLNAIKGYGGEQNNPTPGFVIDMKFGDFNLGRHTLKIIVEDQKGKQLAIKTRQFNTYIGYSLEEGNYGFSGLKIKGDGRGSNLRYYKIGKGPNVFFATFAVHGFEDKWDHDGGELTQIAETFKNRLVSDKDANILNKWTIYIFPEVNPDGARYGWSNNGPGRRTLYSWAPGNEGIDTNRCWQNGSYTRYTGRNYNGTEAFQAYEASYLKEFLESHKATNGQTVLIDLHGWTTQLIGDYGICHECYAPYFPSNSYTGRIWNRILSKLGKKFIRCQWKSCQNCFNRVAISRH